eukprot:8834945-Pyramimonas_sp.AAC.1
MLTPVVTAFEACAEAGLRATSARSAPWARLASAGVGSHRGWPGCASQTGPRVSQGWRALGVGCHRARFELTRQI